VHALDHGGPVFTSPGARADLVLRADSVAGLGSQPVSKDGATPAMQGA
jgi:hypothetical protein